MLQISSLVFGLVHSQLGSLTARSRHDYTVIHVPLLIQRVVALHVKTNLSSTGFRLYFLPRLGRQYLGLGTLGILARRALDSWLVPRILPGIVTGPPFIDP